MTPAIERAAAAAARAAAERVAERLRGVAGVTVTRDGGEVTVRGGGLSWRRVEEPALRWPGGGR